MAVVLRSAVFHATLPSTSQKINPTCGFLVGGHKRQAKSSLVVAAVACEDNNTPNNQGLVSTRDKEPEKLKRNIVFSGEKPSTPILDTINYPVHMKNLSLEELEKLADELRMEIVYTVSKIGGHLSASLGVVELSVALHHVFNAPDDKIIWDVGHQAYVHKILTGRRSRMHTIRQTSGLAGFPKRDESVYDAFGAGHSSTSISAGLGIFQITIHHFGFG